jgi:Taurine catabolism dioxygenase TauD, TfdA family
MIDAQAALVEPARTSSAAEARALMERDGAALLTGCEPSAEGSFAAASAVLGERALDVRYQFGLTLDDAAALRWVFEGGNYEFDDDRFGPDTERVRRWVAFFTEFLASRPFAGADQTLRAHVDGYGFGDGQPDHIFQAFEQQSDEGGESVVVDAATLLECLADDPDTRELADFCWNATIDHTEQGLTKYTGTIASRRPSGRLRVVRHTEQAALESSPTAGRDGELLDRWQRLVDDLVDGAPGFKVHRGETLCLDNFRVMHARKPYAEDGRQVHVAWAWSSDAIALLSHDELRMAAT